MTAARRLLPALLVLAAAFVAAGGYIHLREWLDSYRHVPSDAPGAALVRVGFPLDTVVSGLLAVALVAAAFRMARLVVPVVVAAFLFEAGALAFLIASRVGTVFGWTEPIWTTGARQSRAVEIAALVTLALALGVATLGRRLRPAYS